jgi:tripartite-type tricarboxylate transporter receptor subunit TctC
MLAPTSLTGEELMHFGRISLFDLAVAALVAAAGFGAAPAGAADFYAGKTIEFVIGSNPGGGYDIYARAIARHITRHIPGNPTIVPKNLPGAGSAKATTFIHSVAAKDGTVMGAAFPGAIMEPLLGDRAKAAYDPPKLQYIGTADNGTRTCVTWHAAKTKTFEDAMKSKTILGASQAGGSSRDYAYMHNKLNGAKFDIVSGYKGTVDILLAMERGEVEGLCGYDWTSLKTQRPDWLRDKKVNILVQVALDPQPALTQMGVPQIWQYIKSEEDKKVAELIVTQQVFGRPYFLPPGTPAPQVKILRDAFMKTVADPAFLEEAKKLRLDIDPLDGEKVQKMVETLYAAPAAIVEKAKAAVKP